MSRDVADPTAIPHVGEDAAVHRQRPTFSRADEAPMPNIGEPELGALHIRLIAVESLLIALLAHASDQQIALARKMASHIAPRDGFTRHPLTVHASAHITDLLERAARFAAADLKEYSPPADKHGAGQ